MSDPIAVPNIEVLLKGFQNTDFNQDLIDVTVKESLGMASEFTLKVYTWAVNDLELSWIDSQDLALGTRVEIRMGYAKAVKSLIIGEVLSLDLDFSLESPFTLTITGQDLRHKLGRGEKSRPFVSMTDIEIASEVARLAGVEFRGTKDPNDQANDYIAQRNMTDLAFLNQRAQASGYELMMEGTTLIFQALNLTGLPAATLSPITGLTSFSAGISSAGRVGQVVVRANDPVNKGVLEGLAYVPRRLTGLIPSDEIFSNARKTLIRPGLETQEEVDEAAKVEMAKLAAGYLTAHGSCTGNSAVRPGAVVKVEGVGKRLSQKYVVTSATHSFSVAGGYTTSFELRGNVCQ